MHKRDRRGSLLAAALLLALAVLLVIGGQPFALAAQSEATPEPTAEATEECAEKAEACAIVVPLDIPAGLTPEAAPAADPGINPGALYHDSRSDLYRTPGGAAPFGTTVTLRLRAEAGNLDTATVRVWNTREEAQSLLPMQVVATTPDGYDLWETTLDVGSKGTVLWYRFIVTRGNQTLYYEDDTRLAAGSPYLAYREGGAGMVYAESPDLSYQITVYDPAYYTPEWMRNAVVYQIFPDRFRDGDPSNNPADGDEVFYDALPLIFHDIWNEPPVDGRTTLAPAGDQGYFNSDFYGGDLAGITEKLDYLQDLGVTAIYLNPIFLARSNHRYDTVDYLQIDPILGTLEDFQTLVSEADKRGMKLILDGVFNHLSSDSPYFDRFDRFEGDEGACESLESPYRAWFYFAPPRANQPAPCAGDPDPLYYTSWAGFDTIPRINNTIVETRRFFFLDENSVAQTWIREGIGGWRLDVAPDIDNGRDPNNIYWETFRAVLRRLNPETVIIGEEWSDGSEFFDGDEWDSTMNYRLRAGILGFVRDTDFTDNDSNGDRVMYALAPSELDNTIRSIEEDYPQMAYHALMNVLSSHDVSRLFFVVGADPQAQKLAALTQFALPGAPTIYYGDEIAIDAPSIPDSGGNYQDDPYNRAPYPWPDTEGDYYPPPDEDMLAFYQGLGALRRDNPALRTGEMVTLLADDQNGLYVFARLSKADGNAALVALNRSADDRQVRLDFGGLLPTGLTLRPFPDGAPISTDGGSAEISIPARGGYIWTVTADAAAFEAPAAPNGLTAVAQSGQVALEWDALDGAAGYILYRSPVAAGGFEPLTETPISGTTFNDETVTNGFVYYYAAAAVGENGLVGEPGASIMAVPSYTIDETFYVGESAEDRELELVFGLTLPVQAAVKIDGVTDAQGQTPGILARAALIPDGGDLTAALPMAYAGDVDGADSYTLTIMPQEIGEYRVVAQFSADGGLTWITVERADGTLPQVTLAASSDTTPPDAPAEVRVLRASLSGVGLEWDAVEDENLFAYRVYRAAGDEAAAVIAEIAAADGTAYTDSAVVEGETYVYSVAAVDGALNESPLTSAEPVPVARLVVPVTFVAEVPDYTTGKVFIAGDFGSSDYPRWDPAGLEMTQADDTHWTITLDIKEGTAIEYKYVRGDWTAVEKGAECEEIANRRLTVRPDEAGVQQTADNVQKWRDLDACG